MSFFFVDWDARSVMSDLFLVSVDASWDTPLHETLVHIERWPDYMMYKLIEQLNPLLTKDSMKVWKKRDGTILKKLTCYATYSGPKDAIVHRYKDQEVASALARAKPNLLSDMTPDECPSLALFKFAPVMEDVDEHDELALKAHRYTHLVFRPTCHKVWQLNFQQTFFFPRGWVCEV